MQANLVVAMMKLPGYLAHWEQRGRFVIKLVVWEARRGEAGSERFPGKGSRNSHGKQDARTSSKNSALSYYEVTEKDRTLCRRPSP